MSAIVIKKFKKRNGTPLDPAPCPGSDSGESEWGSLGLTPALTTPIGDRAFCYFRATFVIGNARSFRYLESIYAHETMDLHLSASIHAVGLASLAKATRSRSLHHQATLAYISALHLINNALASSAATTDTTLSAVMLLDQFEKIIPPPDRTPRAWTTHLNGATALMRMRGCGQFETKAGLEMFIQMSSHLLVSCMQHSIPLPADYLLLRDHATNFIDTTDISWRLSEVTVRYIAFRSSIKSGGLFNPDTIIATASAMDHEMVALIAEFPPSWLPNCVSVLGSSELVLGDHYDVYLDYRVAEPLNMVRAGRIPLLDLIEEQCEMTGDYEALEGAKEKVRDVGEVVCASVPQLAGYVPFLELSSTSRHSSPDSLDGSTFSSYTSKSMKLDPSNEASAYSLLWPLFTVANSRSCPDDAKWWITRQLRVLGGMLGSEEALELAEGLEMGVERDVWGVYAVLGSICYSVGGC